MDTTKAASMKAIVGFLGLISYRPASRLVSFLTENLDGRHRTTVENPLSSFSLLHNHILYPLLKCIRYIVCLILYFYLITFLLNKEFLFHQIIINKINKIF